MSRLFCSNPTRSEILERVGDVSQVAGARRIELCDGSLTTPAPGESREYEIELSVVHGASACLELERSAGSLVTGAGGTR